MNHKTLVKISIKNKNIKMLAVPYKTFIYLKYFLK